MGTRGISIPQNNYGYNDLMAYSWETNAIAMLGHPSQLLLLADSRCSVTGTWANDGLVDRVAYANNFGIAKCANCNSGVEAPYQDSFGRHNDGENIAYADGHVKWLKWEAIRVPPNGSLILDPKG